MFRFHVHIPARESRAWRALGLILFVGLIGVLGFMLVVPGMGFLHALYATVITLSTVGYQDPALAELKAQQLADPDLVDRVMLFETFLVVFGIGAVMFAFSAFVRSVVEGELREAIGQQRTKRRLLHMKDHYIICGFGRIGEIIAENMQKENIPTVIVEVDPEALPRITALGLTGLVGDATNDDLLRQAEVEKAKGLIAVTDSDPENLFVTLSARQLNPNLTIVSRALSPDAEKKLLRAGANRVILPYKIGAHHLAQAALRPNISDFIEIATGTSKFDFGLEELRVESSSKLAGKTLKEATILRELGLIVLGVLTSKGDRVHFNPPAETTLNENDTLIVLGKHESLTKVQAHFR